MLENPAKISLLLLALTSSAGGFCGYRAGWTACRRDHDAGMARIRWLAVRKASIQHGMAHPEPGEWSPLLRELEARRARERGREATTECLTIFDMYDSASDRLSRTAREESAERGAGKSLAETSDARGWASGPGPFERVLSSGSDPKTPLSPGADGRRPGQGDVRYTIANSTLVRQ